MHVYDTLIIGCGYGAVGYAAANKNTLICEERQICDNTFCLPLRSFAYSPYSPKTAEGNALQDAFSHFELFKDGMQNTNGFEFALCKYVSERDLRVLLKCRVIQTEKRTDGVLDVTLQTNAGLSHVFTKKLIRASTVLPKQKRLTVLFMSKDFQAEKDALCAAFCGATVEKAFYENRYALHIPVENTDENAVKLFIHKTWKGLNIGAKILYIAPVFFGYGTESELCDMRYENPIEAFEAGYFHAKKEQI